MNFWLRVFSTFFLSLVLILVLPWWAIAVGGFIVGLLSKKTGIGSFFSGFLGVALLWWGYAGYLDVSTQSILTVKTASTVPSSLRAVTTSPGAKSFTAW